MSRTTVFAAAMLSIATAACSSADEPAATQPTQVASEPAAAVGEQEGPAPEFYSYDGWIGHWIGVEGMFLDVRPAGDGNYTLEMQWDLDNSGTFTGTPTAAGITFEREGETFTLAESTGDATGLRYLAGKEDCMMVREGEGYCRD